jgi:Cu/Zn superoxide dismutase
LALVNRPGLILVAAIALFGLGALMGMALGQPNSLAAETPNAETDDRVSDQLASPVAATPISAQRVLDTIFSGSPASDVVDTALTESTTGAGRVNVFVEVNTFVGLGTLSTGEHGIHVSEADSCETGENGP